MLKRLTWIYKKIIPSLYSLLLSEKETEFWLEGSRFPIIIQLRWGIEKFFPLFVDVFPFYLRKTGHICQ